MSNPVQDALNAANAQANQAQAAQPIQQEVQQTGLQPTAQNTGVVTKLPTPGVAMTMDDAAVAAVSGVSGYIKLRDGGLELNEAKFGPVKFELKIESSDKGGSYQPCLACNYNSPTGQVYTKSYDGQTTVSNNAAHNGLGWAENVALCQRTDAKAYSYTAFELTLSLLEDTASVDGKTTLTKGSTFGYTTPYTASKLAKALWDKAIAEGKRGDTVIVELQGEEVSKGSQQYKKLVMNQIN